MEIGQHPKIGILIYVLLSQVWNSPNPIFEGKQTFFQEMSNILSAPVKNEPQIEFFSSIQTEMIECFCRNRITTNEIEIDFKVSRLVADFFFRVESKKFDVYVKIFCLKFCRLRLTVLAEWDLAILEISRLFSRFSRVFVYASALLWLSLFLSLRGNFWKISHATLVVIGVSFTRIFWRELLATLLSKTFLREIAVVNRKKVEWPAKRLVYTHLGSVSFLMGERKYKSNTKWIWIGYLGQSERKYERTIHT